MAEYIEREALIQNMQECKGDSAFNIMATGYAYSFIKNAPSADVVEVVHAYWKETTHITESKRGREIHSKLYNCSNCDAPNGRKKSSYCHWCGAKMDGERRSNDESV